MQAIILAGGEGIRLGQNEVIPKSLLKVGKRTILEHNISQLPQDVTEIVVVVSSIKNQIRDTIGANFAGRHIKYVEQPERLGTGHALFMAKGIINDKKFVVMMGDNLYIKRDIENSLRHHLCLLAHKVDVPDRLGLIQLKTGVLNNIIESPRVDAGALVNCGLYVLDRRIFSYQPVLIGDKDYGLPQTIAKMAADHRVDMERASFWLPINTIQDLKQADRYLKRLYT